MQQRVSYKMKCLMGMKSLEKAIRINVICRRDDNTTQTVTLMYMVQNGLELGDFAGRFKIFGAYRHITQFYMLKFFERVPLPHWHRLIHGTNIWLDLTKR